MPSSTPSLILASASPRRRELLGSLGVSFEIAPAEIVENEDRDGEPKALVAQNAAMKAEWVSQRNPDALVLGADTTVFIGHQVLNKPADRTEAIEMLRLLSGRAHSVFTGLALRRKNSATSIDCGVESRVFFRSLDDATIETYLSRVHTLDKAGGYAIQEHGELIVERYEGSFSNIVGLPLDETKQILDDLGLLS
ncbi:MAG: Maf family protein [Synoicihabitans sp.]